MANTTVQTLVEAALAGSTANDPGKLSADAEMINMLDRVYQMFWGIKARSQPAKHTAKSTLVGVASVYTLPQNMIDIRRVDGKTGTVGAGVRIPVIPLEEKDRTWHIAPRLYRLGETLVSVGAAGDPGATDSIDLFYMDVAATLTAFSSQLDDRYDKQYQELLVTYLKIYLSSKDPQRDATEFGKLTEMLKGQIGFFLQGVGASTTALTSPLGGEIKQFLDSLYTTKPTQR